MSEPRQLENPKLTINNLKIDMTVKESQLSEIYDTHMILGDSILLDNNDVEGRLLYFGDGKDKQYEKWFNQSETPITPIYFSSSEKDIYYDE